MKTFHELIRVAQGGNSEALLQLVDQFDFIIKAECRKFGLWEHPDISQSDLSQEALMRVLINLNQFRGTESKNAQALFESWLRTTTRNTVKNILRRLSNQRNSPELPIRRCNTDSEFEDGNQNRHVTASSIVSKQEQDHKVRQAMHLLPDDDRVILQMRILEAATWKQIASHLGTTSDKVRYHFELSLAKMQSLLGDDT